jgi:hypothetical protein
MARTAVLSVRIISDGSQARQDLDQTASRMDKFRAGLDKATVPAAAAGAGVLAFAKKTGEMASIAQQNAGAVDSVFKGNAATITAFADTAADKLGLSASSYQEMASVIGSQLKNMGVPMDAVAGSTNDLIAKGADLAAMFGGTTSDAVAALSSLLRGERDPIERYGVSINQAAIDAQKAAMGLSGLSGEADKNANLQATMALLTKQTADAQGQFAREAESAAGAQQRANAKLEDAGAKIGTAFLPAMTAAANVLGAVALWASENSTTLAALAVTIGVIAGAVLLINGALRAYQAITVAVTAVQAVFNAVLAANPVMLVVLAIVALVAAVVWAYNNVGWFRDFVDGAFKFIGEVIGTVARWFQETWDKTILGVTLMVEWLRAQWDKIFNAIWMFILDKVIKVRNAWETATAAVNLAIEFVRAQVFRVFDAIWTFINGVVTNVRNAWENATGAVNNAVSTVREAFASAFERARSIAEGALGGINRAIQGVIGWVQNAIGWVQSLFGQTNNARNAASGLGGATSAVGYLLAPAGIDGASIGATGFLGGPAGTGSSSRGFGSVTNVNVTVNGALDPAAVGRQVRDLVLGSLRNDGRVPQGVQPW